MSAAVDAVVKLLESAGFERLPKPLVIAGAAFDFDAAVTGTRFSHDLVVIGGGGSDHHRLAQLLSGLSRRLDRVESRRPVSVVLLGPRPSRDVVARLEAYARVLVVDSTEPTAVEVEDAVAVLLPIPLQTRATGDTNLAPLAELAATFGDSLTSEHRRFIDAAPSGIDTVRHALQRFIDEAFDGADKKDGR